MTRLKHLCAATLLIATPALVAAPAFSQSAPRATTDERVIRLEKEMKAVQRKVFPGGTPAFFEPEIQAQAPDAAPVGTPATQPLNELNARVSAVERELAKVTAALEETQHRLDIVSQSAARDRAEFDARLKALEPAPETALPPEGAPPKPGAKPAYGKPLPNLDSPAPAPAAAKPPVATPAKPKPEDAPSKDAAKPASADPGEDAYMAGYKLWNEKDFAGAETALAEAVKKYPKHKRISYSRNLLGRAQLDGGKPATAAQTFLGNYQADPHGDRAPDSLFYLGQSLTQLKKTDNACRAYDELQDVYGDKMSETIKGRLPAARKAANCATKP